MRLTEHFTKEEFDSKDGAEMPQEVFERIQDLAVDLELLRTFLGVPIKINSGYRSPSHNDYVGGSPNSQHLKGTAADLNTGLDSKYVANVLEGLIRLGLIEQGGIGIYDTFVHYDQRGTKARWDG